MSRDAIKLERKAWDRAYSVIRGGQNLPASESRLQKRIHSAVLASLLRRLFGTAPPENLSDVVAIRFTVLNHPGLELTVQLPRPAAEATTLGDLADEIEGIADRLPHNGRGTQQFLRAQTSLGREVYVNEPMVPQLESDQRVVLIFGHPFDFGTGVA